jgi:hypothetical protein
MTDPGQASGCINVTANGVTIKGNGEGNTTITQPSTQNIQNLIYIGTTTRFDLEDVTENGNESNQTTTGDYFTCIRSAGGGSDITIDNDEFVGCGDRAIDIRGAARTWVDKIYAHDTGIRIAGAALGTVRCGNAVSIDEDGTIKPSDGMITDSVFNQYGDAVACDNAAHCTVKGNIVRGAKYFGHTACQHEGGIDMSGSNGITLDSNVVQDIQYGPTLITSQGQIPRNLSVPTQTGTAGTITDTYVVLALNNGGTPIDGGVGNTNFGNSTLNGTNYNVITWPTMTGAVNTYQIWRIVGGSTQGVIASVSSATLTYSDQGAAGNGATLPNGYALGIAGNVVISNNKFIIDAACGAVCSGQVSIGDGGQAAQTFDYVVTGNTFSKCWLNVSGASNVTISGNAFQNSNGAGAAQLNLDNGATVTQHMTVIGNTFSSWDGSATLAVNFDTNVLTPGYSLFSDNGFPGFTTANQYVYEASATKNTIATNAPGDISSRQWSSDANSPLFEAYKARGTTNLPTAIVANDITLTINGWGFDGTTWDNNSNQYCFANGTVSSGIIPTACYFQNANTSGVLGNSWSVDQFHNMTVYNGLYPSSAGAALGSTGAPFAGTFTNVIAASGNTPSTFGSNRYAVASDFTTAANTNLQTITGLSWTLPASTALNVPFQCHLAYSQATANVADSFGIQATVAPTNIFASGEMWTNTTATFVTPGVLPTLSSTTATAVVTATPAAAVTTVLNADLNGFIENPSTTANTINIMVKTATAADVVTVKRGSFCVIQ